MSVIDMAARRAPAEPEHLNEDSWRDFARELRAEGKRPRTLEAYHQGFTSLWDFCERDLLSLAKADIQEWLIDLERLGRSQATRANYYRGVQRFYRWAADEGIIGASPMDGMKPPKVDDVPVPIPPKDDIRQVLAVVERDKSFEGLRDAAIIRTWCEPGTPRASEMADLPLAQVDLDTDEIRLQGKGGKWRSFPLSAKTARAWSRYLRARAAHPYARLTDQALLGKKGPMTRSGMYQLAERRCAEAGVPRIHPHQFRHYTTDAALTGGVGERDVMRLMGWSTPAMLSRYGAAAADRRATAAARALALGNDL